MKAKSGITQPETSWATSLQVKACHNEAARTTQGKDGTVAVYIKNIRPTYSVPPISWVIPFKPERRFVLDPLGSFVWHECDGRRTIEEIIDHFSERYRLTFHEARVSVTQYIQLLVKRGALALILPRQPGTEPTS